MINYSITARAVNNNLFEINQAKARIAQAKAEGKTPDTKDEALVESVVTNYFATAQYTEVMSIEKFARHIADHGTTYSRADIMAILYMAVDCMREQLLEGKKIRLGELGDFSVALSSKGAETAEKFSSQNIQRVTVCWEPGSEFRNLLADAEFNLVATRSAQAAVLKAIKEGKTNVDISAPITPGNPGGGTSTPGVRSEVSFSVRGFCVLPSLHLSKAKPDFGVARTVCVLPSSKVPPPETLPWLSLADRTVSVRLGFG